jgi:lipopolysaccharide/colanic/teichoic acid biosynthesis glycosyltransferase
MATFDWVMNMAGMEAAYTPTMVANYHAIQANDSVIPRWKRILDITLILVALPLLLVLGAGLALLIRLVSRGPVFFRQERVGHLGRRFLLLKFRTMHVGAETAVHQTHLTTLLSSDAPMLKMDVRGDARIIPLGIWIRAAGLDELPQLINVLRGEMSLVGPRPCLPFELDKYRDWREERFNTLPGLTGLWQVSGKNNTTFQEMVQLDIEYSRTKTLTLDLEIIVRTIPALIVQVLEMRRHRRQSVLPVAPLAPPAPMPDYLSCRSYHRQTVHSPHAGRNGKRTTRNIRTIIRPN